ncbi:hypothetical protein BOVA115_2007 [Bacteroides ovatus]|nr:hypothetical protein BOVA115_2007 [Bacteroides ovatus]
MNKIRENKKLKRGISYHVSMKKEKTGSWGAGLLCIYTVR